LPPDPKLTDGQEEPDNDNEAEVPEVREDPVPEFEEGGGQEDG
jgi:hypothetical protein